MSSEMKLGEMIQHHCKQKNWSLTKLSKESKVALATIHGWTAGRTRPDISQLRKVAAALQVPLFQLAFGENDPNEQIGEEILKEIFTGDVRVTLHRIERRRK